MRLIDADALEKRMGDRLNSLRKEYGNYDHYTDGYEEGCVAVEDAETIDAVPVVRCKDCIYYETGKDYLPYCNHADGGINDYPQADDFCSYGERKADED